MDTQVYTQWLNNPYHLTEDQTVELKSLIEQFPYLQSARALYLKTLHQQRSFLYNNELKKTAAYTTDRDVLFDYIVSEDFIAYKPLSLNDLNVIDEDYIQFKKPEPTLDETIEKTVLDTLVYIENQEKETELIQKIDQISKAKLEAKIDKTVEHKLEIKKIEEDLEVGKPLDFTPNDKLSFTEWLKLTSTQPIQRNNEDEKVNEFNDSINEVENNDKIDESGIYKDRLSQKMDLINRFIETNPKITPSKTTPATPIFIDKNPDDESFYMTETLAKIYLEQKKYQKAIQAYEILILKYPEKSSLFANRISDIKKLQEFNNI